MQGGIGELRPAGCGDLHPPGAAVDWVKLKKESMEGCLRLDWVQGPGVRGQGSGVRARASSLNMNSIKQKAEQSGNFRVTDAFQVLRKCIHPERKNSMWHLVGSNGEF